MHSTDKTVLVAAADGAEEIETVSIVNVLTRGGAKVTLASVMSYLDADHEKSTLSSLLM
jgi:putative intracellular protease/amidase